jgi:hypothetical protein
MITFSDVISLADGLNEIEALDEIIQFGIFELGENHVNPEMILLIMDLATRAKVQVRQEMRDEIQHLRELIDRGVQLAQSNNAFEPVTEEA